MYITYNIVFTTSQFQIYETLRYFIIKQRSDRDHLTLQESVQVSVVVQTLACLLINPLDVVITRYQIINESKEPLSTRRIVREIYQKEGVASFLSKGLTSRLTQQIGYGLLWLPAYDYFKS